MGSSSFSVVYAYSLLYHSHEFLLLHNGYCKEIEMSFETHYQLNDNKKPPMCLAVFLLLPEKDL